MVGHHEGASGAHVWINREGSSPGIPVAAPGRLPEDRRLRRWPRRLLVGANIVALGALVAAGAGYGYVRYELGKIHRFAVNGLHAGGTAAPSQPENILLIGSDTRAGSGGKFGSTAQVAGQRSDVIIVVHLDPATGKAAMLSIPRDTFVNVVGAPPYNGPNKINASYNAGPSGLVQTIQSNFAIPIDHVVQVNFTGLSGVTDAVGGVCMYFPYPTRDGSPTGTGNESGLNEPAGNDVLNGTQALSLVRSRYYQYYRGGQWIAEGTGDLGRIKRQHEFLRVLAAKAIHDGIHNPVKANSLVSQMVGNVKVDNSLTVSDMLGLIGQFHSLRPSTVPSYTLPTTVVNNYQGYGDVLMPTKSADAQVISDWANVGTSAPSTAKGSGSTGSSSPSTTLVPSEISVEVLNGSGAPGQAAQADRGLVAAGFTVTTTGNAASFAHATSVVTYGPGLAAAAQVVAEHVQGGASIVESPSLTGSSVVLTTGSSFTGISPTAVTAMTTAPTAATTTTTVAGGATTGAPGQSPYPPWDPTPCTNQAAAS